MRIYNNILSVEGDSIQDVLMRIAANAKARRLDLNLSQKELSLRADLKLPTYRRFERTGEISFRGLLKVAFALNLLRDFEGVFAQRQYRSIDDVIRERKFTRKRASKNE